MDFLISIFLLFLLCFVPISYAQDEAELETDLVEIAIESSGDDIDLVNSTLIVDVSHDYYVGEVEYTFGTQDVYLYNEENEQYILDPFVKYTLCVNNLRPEVCYDTDAPVCGYATSCPDGVCTKTLQNDCLACADLAIGWYVKGICEEVQTSCRSGFDAACSVTDYAPVCAVASECSGDYCSVTILNSCQACTNPYINFYLPGQCPNSTVIQPPDEEEVESGSIFCDPSNRPTLCTLEFNPQCAHQRGCRGNTCSWTTANPCTACYNETIDYYISGECPGQSQPQANPNTNITDRVFCDPTNRPISCPLDFNPVCTFAQNCAGEGCNATSINPCVSCSILNADYYLVGECLGQQAISIM